MKSIAVAAVLSVSLLLSACGADPEPSAPGPTQAPLVTQDPSPAPAPQVTVTPKVEEPKPGTVRIVAPGPSLRKLPPPAPAPIQRQASGSQLKGPWGVYKGNLDQLWPAYERARGTQKKLIGEIALLPRASKWFGTGLGPNEIEGKLRDYIVNSQAGNPKALVQITIFRMDPWYTDSKTKVPSPKQVRQYKTWVRNSAKAIGNTRTALYLQPDSTFLRTVPNYKLSTGLIKYAARTYGALPNTRVYLETGGYDWPAPGQGGAVEAARLLQDSGIQYADGIVTNTTHYNGVENDIRRVAELVEIFNSRGIKGLKGVINTSSSGNGFDFGNYTGPDPDNAFVCKTRPYRGTCVALGIPPTWDVANPRWGLSAEMNAMARKYVDAYAWVGRPWLYRQADPFQMKRAIPLVQNWNFR